MLKVVFYIAAFTMAAALLLWLSWHVLSMLYMVGFVLFWLAILGAVMFGAWHLFIKPRLPQFRKNAQYRLVDAARSYVYAFRLEPSMQDIVLLHDELHLAQLELAGDILQLNNDTVIKIVEDSGKAMVKVQVAGSKSQDKVFWVPRSCIVKPDQDKPTLLY